MATEMRDLPPPTPCCSFFGECGGCQLQHLGMEAYAALKEQKVREALTRAGYETSGVKPLQRMPDASRRRVEWACWRAPEATAPTLGFFRQRSHTPIPIAHCPVLTPALAEASGIIGKALAADFPERLPAPEALHLTEAENGIDALWILPSSTPYPPSPALETALGKIARGGAIIRASLRCNQNTQTLWQETTPEIACGAVRVPVPPGLFLQASREGQAAITDAALDALSSRLSRKSRVLDLFAGIGTYSFPMAPFAKIHAVEGNGAMVELMQATANRHGLSGRITAEMRDLMRFPIPASALNAYDAAIINPPRAGAVAQCRTIGASTLRRMVMISCNPDSFARDAGILRQAGFALAWALPIDQFVYTDHIETVAYFTR